MKRTIITNLFLLLCLTGLNVNAQSAIQSLDDLLELVRQGRVQENQVNRAREQEFIQNRNQQQQMLQDANNERTQLEQESERLEGQFEQNELQIADLREQLSTRMGSLRELFGVLQQAAGDARGSFENSLTNIEYPERTQFLNVLAEKMGSTTELASLEEIEQLWFELQREMTEQGKIKKITTRVVTASGDEANKEILRVGVFNIISDGKYLSYNPDTGTVAELVRQPAQRFLDSAEALENASSGVVA
ncbi:MAG: energy transducer TonB, partial [Gammaproteobacteria bacterium]